MPDRYLYTYKNPQAYIICNLFCNYRSVFACCSSNRCHTLTPIKRPAARLHIRWHIPGRRNARSRDASMSSWHTFHMLCERWTIRMFVFRYSVVFFFANHTIALDQCDCARSQLNKVNDIDDIAVYLNTSKDNHQSVRRDTRYSSTTIEVRSTTCNPGWWVVSAGKQRLF